MPAANWVLELLDAKDDLEVATGTKKEAVAKPFITKWKNNISSQFASQDVSSFSIFDPKKVPGPDSLDLPSYGKGPVDALINHYGADRLAETVQHEEYVKQALTSSELRTEWKAFRNYLSKQPRGTLQSQLKELKCIKQCSPSQHSLKHLSCYSR